MTLSIFGGRFLGLVTTGEAGEFAVTGKAAGSVEDAIFSAIREAMTKAEAPILSTSDTRVRGKICGLAAKARTIEALSEGYTVNISDCDDKIRVYIAPRFAQ